jgi:hypothetical protein
MMSDKKQLHIVTSAPRYTRPSYRRVEPCELLEPFEVRGNPHKFVFVVSSLTWRHALERQVLDNQGQHRLAHPVPPEDLKNKGAFAIEVHQPCSERDEGRLMMAYVTQGKPTQRGHRYDYGGNEPYLAMALLIKSSAPYRCEVRAVCWEPQLTDYFQRWVEEIRTAWQAMEERREQPSRGRPAPSTQKKLEVVLAWYEAKERRVKQRTFCAEQGISTATLRRYEEDLREKGEL